MKRSALLLACMGSLLLSGAAWAQQGMKMEPAPMNHGSMDHGPMHAMAMEPDTRELLKLSPEALSGLRTDMRHMLVSLSQVLDALGAGKRMEAAKTLEEGLGMTAMTTHPGMMKANKELPESARTLGMSTHQAASRLAKTLASAKPEQVFAGLQEVTGGCAACHSAYRVR